MKKNLYVQKEIERKKFQSNYSSKSMEREKLFSKDVNSTSSVLYQVREINSFYTPQNIHRNRIREPDILTRSNPSLTQTDSNNFTKCHSSHSSIS